MTWKERRTVTLLLSILGVLFAILLIILGVRYRENRPTPVSNPDAPSSPSVASVDPEAFSALQYNNGAVTLSFALDGEGRWIWTDTPDFPLDSANIQSILDILANLHFQQTITSPDTMESYGLDNPGGTLTVTDNRGGSQTLAFGKATTDGGSRYVQLNGDSSTIYIIDGEIYEYMQTPVYDMMRLPELPDLSEENLRAITIEFPAPESEAGDGEPASPPPAIKLTASRTNGGGQTVLWFCGGDNVTSSLAVQELLSDLKTMAFQKCVDYHPSEEASSICGFDAPELTLTVEYGTDASLVLEAGGKAANDSGRYVCLDGDSTIYLLPEEKLDGLMKVAAREFDR